MSCPGTTVLTVATGVRACETGYAIYLALVPPTLEPNVYVYCIVYLYVRTRYSCSVFLYMQFTIQVTAVFIQVTALYGCTHQMISS